MIYKFELKVNEDNAIEIDEPVGWDDVNLEIVRDMKNYGLSFEFSDTLSFYKEARTIIYNAWQTYNIDAKIIFTAYYKASVYDNTWLVGYSGILVLRDVNFDNKFAKCRVEQSDDLRKFRNTIDLSCKIIPNKTVKLHSKVIKNKSLLKVNETFKAFDFNVTAPGLSDALNVAHTLLFDTINEVKNINDLSSVLVQGNYFSNAPTPIATFVRKGFVRIDARLKGEVKIKSLNNVFRSRLIFVNHYPNYVASNPIVIYNSGSVNTTQIGQTVIINFDFTFNDFIIANEGDSFWSFFRVVTGNNNPGAGVVDVNYSITFDEVSFMEIVQDTLTLPSQCEGSTIINALEQTLIGNNLPNVSIESDYLQTINDTTLITNGFKIRGLNEKEIKTSFLFLYENLRKILNIGISYEKDNNNKDVVRIENFDYFFTNELLIVINNPNELNLQNAQDFYFNKILVGYKEWNNQGNGQINGLDEFNSSREYSTAIKLGNYNNENEQRKEFNIVSEFITAGYLIEFQRRIGLGSTDSSYDNSAFLIALNINQVTSDKYNDNGTSEVFEKGEVSERNENFISLTDVLSASTVYNARYSPIRNLLRWCNYIKTQLNKNIDNLKLLEFRNSQGNFLMNSCANAASEMITTCIAENGTIDTTSTSFGINSILDAEILEFEYPLDFYTFEQIKNNFKKYIIVNQGTYQFKGYVQKITFNVRKGIGKFKLIKKYDT